MTAHGAPDPADDTAHRIVERYLRARTNPDALIDRTRVEQVRRDIDTATDPMVRVRLRERLRQLLDPDPDALEAQFIDVVARWADQTDVSAAALLAEGVDVDVLRRAGMVVEDHDIDTAADLTTTRPPARRRSEVKRPRFRAGLIRGAALG